MDISPFQITALYAGILAIMLVALGLLVIKNRYRAGVPLFDGGDAQLGQVIRIHGNFIEHVPMAILVMAFAEAGGSPHWLVHGLGIALVLGRLSHASGLYDEKSVSKRRTIGVLVTMLVLVAGGLASIGFGILGY